MLIQTLFFLLLILWANSKIAMYVYCFVIRGEKFMSFEEFSKDEVIQKLINQALIGKYGAFAMAIYIIGSVLGIYTL